MEILGLVVLLVCMVGVLMLVVGAARPSRRGAPLARYASPVRAGGMVTGLVSALAASAAVSAIGAGTAPALTIGALVGVLFAVLTTIGSTTATRMVAGCFGAVGAIAAIGTLAAGGGCSTIPASSRVVVIVVLLASSAVGIIAGVLKGSFRPDSPLGVFGAIRVVAFLSSPFGLSLLQLPWTATAVALVSAVAFGLAAGSAASIVIGLSALAVSLGTLAVSASVGLACDLGGQPADLAVLLGFVTCYMLCRGAFRVVAPR